MDHLVDKTSDSSRDQQSTLQAVDEQSQASGSGVNVQKVVKNSNEQLNTSNESLSINEFEKLEDQSLNVSEISLNSGHSQENLQDQPENPINSDKMPQSKADFIKLAGPILNYIYNGDPLKLSTFITDIELVVELAEAEQEDLCFKFIKSKLEGRALEAMPDELETVDQIKTALEEKIKSDSSRVIAGKMASLRLIKGNYSTFAKQAEDLAEAFRRSLVLEGMSKAKAEEMSIDETTKICRKIANNDIVKSVLAGSKYASPAEVIAKFITESDIARQEYQQKQTAQLKKQNNSNKKFDKNKKGGQYQNPNGNRNSGGQNNQNGKKTYYNSNFKGNKGQQQRTETIRLVQGNQPSPPEGGPSSNAQGVVYQFTNA